MNTALFVATILMLFVAVFFSGMAIGTLWTTALFRKKNAKPAARCGFAFGDPNLPPGGLHLCERQSGQYGEHECCGVTA